ncbi:class I SAM-dependent methyltransferase [Candidatus Woesearchaeota archaeon]|jgi:ubiquinone/menaquinone biosynthesis C-methylase UbiE|nr:class I SAM-dependent methyltransferase [Candidatus Woesearchaeota archaeon]MBT4835385.1 class I SAM-dependent methyltransferase [Candidatus Woesearchaeota archaeon]MBT6735019.1 class I SAM-dependent methyltransferase [Candidatus Woesearchaeota archaeon]MBT7169878.1 class I SAM-dependent methyltransferase [Candidatus Woesearchaeota archaeon]MBT7474880.1 class I SAM-dependent methyltransferase [Candidatus Woesearchaeota archaeon]
MKTNEKFKQAIKTYNKIAKIYAKYTEAKLMQFQLTRFESLLQGKKILDAGSGSGRDVAYFLEDDFDAVGIDISQGQIKEAKKRVPKGKFLKQDFRKTKFEDNSLDGIWCMEGFVHLPKTEIKKALKEFKRILKEDGIIYLSLKRGKGTKIIKQEIYSNEPLPYYYYEQKEIESLANDLNFKIISSEENNVWVELFLQKINQ